MTIRSLLRYSNPRKIFVITPLSNFGYLEDNIDTHIPLFILDEDNLFEYLNYKYINDILVKRIGSDIYTGWYFQQFLKMSFCNFPGVANYYLIWDSDTVLLKKLEFFDNEGNVLINPKKAHHKPYFILINKLLGYEKQVNYSFISEHLMVKTEYMKELLCSLKSKTPKNSTWIELILKNIDNKYLEKSGFSEYETYGNFIARNHTGSFKYRPIKSIRIGSKLFGNIPDKYNIFSLMLLGYSFVSFEKWHSKNILRIFANRLISRILFNVYQLINHNNVQLKDATDITGTFS